MSQVKVFIVSGEVKMGNFLTKFRKKVRALKPEDALERVYKELGGQHKVKRRAIKILSIEESEPESEGNEGPR
ncbi:MAG: 50S ribosomal protein L18Ae [Candidatus Bathyarchaeia archaeon]